MSKSDGKNSNDDWAIGLCVFAVGVLIALIVIKYSPFLLTGLLIGMILYGSRFELGLYQKARLYLIILSAFCILLFVIFGLPIDDKSSFPGVLSYFDFYNDFCLWCVRTWNDFIPSTYKGFRITSFSLVDATNTAWISVYIALFVSGGFFALDLMAKNPVASKISWLNVASRAVSKPPRLILHLIGGRWLHAGFLRASETKQTSLFSNLKTWGFPALLGVSAWFANRVEYWDLRAALQLVTLTPAAALIVGYITGLTPWGRHLIAYIFSRVSQSKLSELFLLGCHKGSTPYYLTERNLAYHVQIVAPTGSGKTNLLKNLIADRILRGHGVIFMDFKAEFEMVHWAHRVARSVGREGDLRLLSLANPDLSVPYNPVKLGSHTELHSQLMNSMKWSEEYYRKLSSVALLTLLRGLCEYRDKTSQFFHLGHILQILEDQNALSELVSRLERLNGVSAQPLRRLTDQLEKPSEREKLSGLVASLSMLVHSAAGPLLSRDVEKGAFDLNEAISQKRITYFLMNSLKLRESATVFGKLLLQDFMRLLGDRYADTSPAPKTSVTLIIDEFASFAMPEFIEFMDRARGAGIGVMLAHQSRADLKAISPEFQNRVEDNANTTIVSGISNPLDAEHFAKKVGTQLTTKETIQVQREFMFFEKPTGMKSVRDVNEFLVHPDTVKGLQQGQVLAISRVVDPKWGLVSVPKAGEWNDHAVSKESLESALKVARDSYLVSGTERYLDLKPLSDFGKNQHAPKSKFSQMLSVPP